MRVLAAVALPWPFEREYMQLALVAGLVVGLCAPLVGAFLVQRRMSLMGDGMGHLAFAGVALGAVLDVWPIWTALLLAVAGAILVERIRRRSRESGDLALALIFYTGIAAGTVLLGLDHSLNANLVSYLFGSILTVTRPDVVTVAIVGLLILAVLAVAGRALFALVIDDEAAEVAGLPVRMLNDVFAVLTAVTVVASMRVVGILLVSALMVLPVGAAQAVTHSFRGLLVASSAIGSLCVVLGLVIARLQGLAPGGTIVLLAAAAYAGTALIVPRMRLRRNAAGPLPALRRRSARRPGSPRP
jgi:zinc transport system permease protein